MSKLDPKQTAPVVAPVDLQAEVERLQQENIRLKALAERGVGPRRSPEDFSTAVQRALDKLQGQLSTMANPVSNFAVREFRIETNVHLQVTEIGDLEYRFVGFDERPDPAVLSRISLDLTPIPKQNSIGTFPPELFKPETSIREIEGLSRQKQKTLHENQIDTVGDLLAAGTRVRAQVELASLLKVDREKLGRWLGAAALLTLRGIDAGRAAVLQAAGFSNLKDVSEANAEELVGRFNEALEKLDHSSTKQIATAEAAVLIRSAQSFLGSVPGDH